jgi:hypothetical protein
VVQLLKRVRMPSPTVAPMGVSLEAMVGASPAPLFPGETLDLVGGVMGAS